MNKRLTWPIALACALAAAPALAADHGDGTPTALNVPDASSDITDVYTWMADANHINLVMDVFPNAAAGSKFSNVVQYVFHTQSKASLLAATSTPATVICTFDATQKISCWVLDSTKKVIEYVNGDPSATAGLASTDGKMRVFAGLRDDPFFFNLAGFRKATATVAGAIAHGVDATNGPITALDANGCPTLTAGAQGAVVTQLKQSSTGGAPLDFFAKGGAATPNDQPFTGNVLSIVITLDKTLINTGGPVVGVWGSTNKAQ
jgi:hypothetical protein